MARVTKFREKWRCQIERQGNPELSRTFLKRADAIAWGKWAEAELARGRPVEEILCGVPEQPLPVSLASEAPPPPSNYTVGDLIRRYLLEVSPHKKSGKYDASTMRLLLADFGRLPITALTSGALSAYKTRRLRSVSASSVTHELGMLHRAYVLAREEWGIEFPGPIPRTRKPPQPKGRTRRVSDDELNKILAATESTELPIIARFAVATAMRRGELMSMQWEHIDLLKRTVLLPETKNGHSRTVPLTRAAVALLESVGPQPSGPVFQLRPDSVSQMWGYAARRAGVHDIRFHDTRHEATSRFFEMGLSQIEVSRITGHLTLSMLNRYVHLPSTHLLEKLDAADDRKRAIAGSDKAWGKTGGGKVRSKKAGLWRKLRANGDKG
ncbi:MULTISPECIES: site-specific integrase [unclassified Achromobacter]|uniref:site-specific integrase n=1 Tax=unclassified Achromobacter TaxID=2626865 RepID=UPI000B518F34|nr:MULTISPECIES: site-specific integrase [unclassified Achromobacter]OWT75447.1 integrase [Achromobacter sp. HZ28]OWT76107.1 integrase [Achromobacter sp. HZ34]